MSNSAFTPTFAQNLQDASATQSGLVNTSAQTLAGVKTFSAAPVISDPSGIALVTSSVRGMTPPMSVQTALTLSGSTPTATLVRAVGIAYSDTNGVWRLKFNASWTVASASRALASATFTGVTFKNVASLLQTFSAVSSAGGVATVGYCTVNSGTITVEHATATTTAYHVSGDVELESKPTWA